LGPLIQIVAKAAKWCLAACFEVTDRFLIKIPKPLIVISMVSGAMCNTKPRPLRVKIKNTLPQRNTVMHTLGAAALVLLAPHAFVVSLRRDQIAKLTTKTFLIGNRTWSEEPTKR
jgi:hypothetical protein